MKRNPVACVLNTSAQTPLSNDSEGFLHNEHGFTSAFVASNVLDVNFQSLPPGISANNSNGLIICLVCNILVHAEQHSERKAHIDAERQLNATSTNVAVFENEGLQGKLAVPDEIVEEIQFVEANQAAVPTELIEKVLPLELDLQHTVEQSIELHPNFSTLVNTENQIATSNKRSETPKEKQKESKDSDMLPLKKRRLTNQKTDELSKSVLGNRNAKTLAREQQMKPKIAGRRKKE